MPVERWLPGSVLRWVTAGSADGAGSTRDHVPPPLRPSSWSSSSSSTSSPTSGATCRPGGVRMLAGPGLSHPCPIRLSPRYVPRGTSAPIPPRRAMPAALSQNGEGVLGAVLLNRRLPAHRGAATVPSRRRTRADVTVTEVDVLVQQIAIAGATDQLWASTPPGAGQRVWIEVGRHAGEGYSGWVPSQ